MGTGDFAMMGVGLQFYDKLLFSMLICEIKFQRNLYKDKQILKVYIKNNAVE